jgi:hypothetical protein
MPLGWSCSSVKDVRLTAERLQEAGIPGGLQLGDLLQNLFNAFPLQSVPKEETILVFVDGAQVSESADVTVDNYGITRYSDGWTYEPNENSIVFHGAAVPGFDAEVQVYYEPIDGMPRALPF